MEKVSRKKFVRGMLALLEKYPREQVLPLLAREVVARGWSGEVDVLMKEAAKLRLQTDGQVEIQVRSARPLPPKLADRLASLFQASSGANTSHLQAAITPALKGGLVAETPTGQLDISIATLLNQLRKKTNG